MIDEIWWHNIPGETEIWGDDVPNALDRLSERSSGFVRGRQQRPRSRHFWVPRRVWVLWHWVLFRGKQRFHRFHRDGCLHHRPHQLRLEHQDSDSQVSSATSSASSLDRASTGSASSSSGGIMIMTMMIIMMVFKSTDNRSYPVILSAIPRPNFASWPKRAFLFVSPNLLLCRPIPDKSYLVFLSLSDFLILVLSSGFPFFVFWAFPFFKNKQFSWNFWFSQFHKTFQIS